MGKIKTSTHTHAPSTQWLNPNESFMAMSITLPLFTSTERMPIFTKRLNGHTSAPSRAGGIRLGSRLGGFTSHNGLMLDRLRLVANVLMHRYSGIASKSDKTR